MLHVKTEKKNFGSLWLMKKSVFWKNFFFCMQYMVFNVFLHFEHQSAIRIGFYHFNFYIWTNLFGNMTIFMFFEVRKKL